MGGVENTRVSQVSNRGHRYFCSNKNKRRGCGRTFSILWADCVRGFWVRGKTLAKVLEMLVRGASQSSAASKISFARSTVCRWWARFKKAQVRLRVVLCRICDPPSVSPGSSPFFELWEHLKKVCMGGVCLVSDFQHRFQESFF
jgi:hypothetical protein